MIKDLVSIIIPAYNASNYLAEAIDSAINQTYSHIEIIVVNDGSSDNGATRDVALSYGDTIRYFEKENGGSSSAINYGIQKMNGEWFSWLSHDDLYYPEKIQNELLFLEKSKIKKSEYSNHILFAACELIDAKGNILHKTSKREMQLLYNEIENIGGNEYLVAQPRKYNFHGCSCLIHRKVFDDVGMFDEKLRILNDVEMWFRIYSKGYHLHYVPEILVKGRIHSQQVSNSIGYSANHQENDMLWKRRLEWLKKYHADNYKAYELLGKNAYLSYRTFDGDRAFNIAALLRPGKKWNLFIRKLFYCLRANIRKLCKKIYLKFR